MCLIKKVLMMNVRVFGIMCMELICFCRSVEFFFFFDMCRFFCMFMEVEDMCMMYMVVFGYCDFVDKWWRNREDMFNINVFWYFMYSKSFCCFWFVVLKNNFLELLNMFFVIFFNFIRNGNSIICIECWKLFYFYKFFLKFFN